MPGWMKHKLESRLPGEISITSDTQMTPPLRQKARWGKVKSLSHVRLFATLSTVAYQASPSMGFSKQEHWSGLPFPSPATWFSSAEFSRSVVSESLWPHESQLARPPCPSPTPGVHPDSVHRVSDAIQPSHLLSSPSPPVPNPSQHQSLFQWVNSSHEVAKVLEFQL